VRWAVLANKPPCYRRLQNSNKELLSAAKESV
jgi:hypothetical protein